LKLGAAILGGLALLLAGASIPAAGVQKAPAAELARRLGCFACHSLHGRGGSIAVPLDGVGGRLTPEQLRLVLDHPRKLHPGAKMPSYAYLPPEERQALAEFLGSLK
jgi:cytochrome c oxidase subunit 2